MTSFWKEYEQSKPEIRWYILLEKKHSIENISRSGNLTQFHENKTVMKSDIICSDIHFKYFEIMDMWPIVFACVINNE